MFNHHDQIKQPSSFVTSANPALSQLPRASAGEREQEKTGRA